MEITSYHSPFGNLLLIASNGSLMYCNWDVDDCSRKKEKILRQAVSISNKNVGEISNLSDREVLSETFRQLDEYFERKRMEFDIPIKLIGTPFQQKVWQSMINIPYATTASYSDLSRIIGREGCARAVAGACGANPIAILIPCHRILASGGKLGGYTGGIDKKIALLSLEASI